MDGAWHVVHWLGDPLILVYSDNLLLRKIVYAVYLHNIH